jgi:O-antigen/teichoic acid export membrane protein
MGRDILRVGLQILFVYTVGDVFGMVFGMFAANILIASILLQFDISLPSWESLRSIFSYAKHASVEGLVGTVLSKMDILLLGWFATDAIVGNYQVALNLSMPALALASVIGAGVLNQVSYDDSVKEDSSITIQHALNYASLLALPIFVGSVVFGEVVVVTVYSSQYQIAGTFIAGLCAYRLFDTQNSILTSVIDGVDRPDLNLRISTIVLIVNLGLGLILFFSYGPIGFVIATVVASSLRFGLSYWYVDQWFDVTIFSRQIATQSLASILMAVVVLLLKNLLTLTLSIIILILGIAGIVYFLALFTISNGFRGLVTDVVESAIR